MRTRPLVGIAAMGLLVLAACGSTDASSGAAGTARAQTTEIRAVKSYRFSPADIKVAPGTEVTWSNEDNFVHNVQMLDGSNATKDLPMGGSASITFENPGLIRYQCSLHPAQMKGTVLVE